jgi:hypothetical protein
MRQTSQVKGISLFLPSYINIHVRRHLSSRSHFAVSGAYIYLGHPPFDYTLVVGF